jgi:hypothetical protein
MQHSSTKSATPTPPHHPAQVRMAANILTKHPGKPNWIQKATVGPMGVEYSWDTTVVIAQEN